MELSFSSKISSQTSTSDQKTKQCVITGNKETKTIKIVIEQYTGLSCPLLLTIFFILVWAIQTKQWTGCPWTAPKSPSTSAKSRKGPLLKCTFRQVSDIFPGEGQQMQLVWKEKTYAANLPRLGNRIWLQTIRYICARCEHSVSFHGFGSSFLMQ